MVAKVLITDAFSSIGSAIHSAFEFTTYKIVTPRRGDVSWSSKDAVTRYLQENQISIVINTVGWSDSMSLEQERLMQESVKGVVPACALCSIAVIQLSSYRVFGGENKTAYSEEDVTAPISALGRGFCRLEEFYQSQLDHFICLRVTSVLDVKGPSTFVRLLDSLCSDGDEIEITSQRHVAPVSVEYLCQSIVAMVNQLLCGSDNWGLFHLSASDPSSYSEFVEAVSDVLAQEKALRRKLIVRRTEVPEDAEEEPLSSVLAFKRCRDNFGIQGRSWRSGLKSVIQKYLNERSVKG